MRRREFLGLLGGAAALPCLARAQQPGRTPRIGILLTLPPSEPGVAPLWKALLEGLQEYGWEDGKNLIFEVRFGGRDRASFGELATHLVDLKVQAILAGNPHSIAGALQATSVIPIVMPGGVDPVRSGWVKSLSRPESNLTGLAVETQTLNGKQLELFAEIDPRIRRVAVLYSPASEVAVINVNALRAEIGPRLGISVLPVPVTKREELQAAFDAMARDRPQGLMILEGPPSCRLSASQ